MFGVRHNLAEEFSEFSREMNYLKDNDNTFAELLDSYYRADKKIYGYERKQRPVDDTYMGTLKKWRVRLKDDIYRRLQKTSVASAT